MRPSALLGLASCGAALNVLLNNDDGFAASNIRELYRLLRADGHDGKTIEQFNCTQFSLTLL